MTSGLLDQYSKDAAWWVVIPRRSRCYIYQQNRSISTTIMSHKMHEAVIQTFVAGKRFRWTCSFHICGLCSTYRVVMVTPYPLCM